MNFSQNMQKRAKNNTVVFNMKKFMLMLLIKLLIGCCKKYIPVHISPGLTYKSR